MALGETLSEQDLKECLPSLKNFTPLKNGGQKQVFKCELVSGESIVLKFVEVESLREKKVDDTALDRVLREIGLINSLQSDYLPKAGPVTPDYYIRKDARFYFYSEQFIDGSTLREIISDRKMTLEEAILLMIHITTAVKILWENGGNVHRDIKPENIIYGKDKKVFVLIDAGIVLALQETSLTPTGYLVGTLPYMSPEQVMGKKRDLDFRSDLYSLGVTMYEALAQRHPYCANGMKESEKVKNILYARPPKLSDVKLGVSSGLFDIIDTLLNKRPHMRYRSCQKLLDKLLSLPHN